MTSILLQDFVEELVLTPESEERFLASGVNWQSYEFLLGKLGNGSGYQVSYLDGILEIVSPSRRHEVTAESIADLLQEYFKATRTTYYPLGSTTFRKKEQKSGKEPDKSYCIGTEKEFPDLAIEVVVTSGGVESLEIYQRLEVKEVWFWQDDQFSIYSLEGNGYKQVNQSNLFPDLDLSMLAGYVLRENSLEAALEFRQRMEDIR